MASLVKTLLNSLPQMLNVLILFGVFVLVSTIVAVQLFQGNFRNRCALTNSTLPYNVTNNITTYDALNDVNITTTYYNLTEPKLVLQMDVDGQEVFCNDLANMCQEGYSCIYRGNPGFGYSNWDNVLYGFIMTVEVVGVAGWTNDMYMVRRFNGNVYSDVYFVFVVIFGNFFVINLLIAVQYDFLSRAFTEIAEKQSEEEKQKGSMLKKPSACSKLLKCCRID